MPSNKNLIESITKIATEKGVEVPNTVGLSNDKLNETLKGLRALPVKADETPEVKADETPEVKADETPEVDQDAEKAAAERAEIVKANKEQALKDKRIAEKADAKARADAIPPYRIADGKCITCKKGPLADGAEIKAEWINGGQETLDSLVDRGFVIKK